MKKLRIFRPAFIALFLFLILYSMRNLPIMESIKLRLLGRKTVAQQVEIYGLAARERLAPYFVITQVKYPPEQVTLLYVKSQKTLAVFAGNTGKETRFIREYPVQAASGKAGPKLAAGDMQVPEGVYKVESLNPNSVFHLSLRLNYPNDDDLEFARLEGRTDLGSDIMIQGKNVSVGCVAIGDEAIEELFVLAADSDFKSWKVILAPSVQPVADSTGPKWLPELYRKIESELSPLLPDESVENHSAEGLSDYISCYNKLSVTASQPRSSSTIKLDDGVLMFSNRKEELKTVYLFIQTGVFSSAVRLSPARYYKNSQRAIGEYRLKIPVRENQVMFSLIEATETGTASSFTTSRLHHEIRESDFEQSKFDPVRERDLRQQLKMLVLEIINEAPELTKKAVNFSTNVKLQGDQAPRLLKRLKKQEEGLLLCASMKDGELRAAAVDALAKIKKIPKPDAK